MGVNNAKLREALESVKELARTIYSTSDKGSSHEDLAERIVELARAALAEPVKNCEVGSPKEQNERHNEFCYAHRSYNKGCGGCPLNGEPCCELAWAQMPYKEGGAK